MWTVASDGEQREGSELAVGQIKTEIIGELQKTEARIDANIGRLVERRERGP